VRDLRLPILDRYRRSVGQVRYTLRVGDEVRQGTTDADGVLLERGIPRGRLSLELEDGRLVRISRGPRAPTPEALPLRLFRMDQTLTPPPSVAESSDSGS
jgi:hypothetical protein